MTEASDALDASQSALAARATPTAVEIARGFASTWRRIPFTDFLSVGHEALVRAARRFEPDRGKPFEQFAHPRIWGAMTDLALRETFVVQAVARRMAAMAYDEPGEVHLDAWLGETTTSPRDADRDTLRGRLACLATMAVGDLEPPRPPTPEASLIDAQERHRLLSALERALADLPERDRQCMHALYDDALTLEATAARIGIDKRTVQRIHDRVKKRLAEEIRAAVEAGQK